MNKLFRLISVSSDVFSQIKDPSKVKLQFLKGIYGHYLFKLFGKEYNSSFPSMKIRVENCTFVTRKHTLDFWMFWKDYEKEIFEQIEQIKNDYSLFVDVGANIGRYTTIMAQKGLNVISFEPIKTNFNQLKLNLKLNKLEKKAKLYNLAVGDKKEVREIFFDIHKHGEGSMVFTTGKEKEIVKVITLDSILKSEKRKAILKIDVEGYEYPVLVGSKRFITRNKPAIIIEIWNKKSENFLKKIGYEKKGEIWFPKK